MTYLAYFTCALSASIIGGYIGVLCAVRWLDRRGPRQ